MVAFNSIVGNYRCEAGYHSAIQECCSSTEQCGEGQGDCDGDSECFGSLVCGRNNCDPSRFPSSNTDCCAQGTTKNLINFYGTSILYHFSNI